MEELKLNKAMSSVRSGPKLEDQLKSRGALANNGPRSPGCKKDIKPLPICSAADSKSTNTYIVKCSPTFTIHPHC